MLKCDQCGRKFECYILHVTLKIAPFQLTDENGETTSHLMGTFYRTIRMVDNGIKPVYVFDGKPPTMKSGELEKRTEKRAEAQVGNSIDFFQGILIRRR